MKLFKLATLSLVAGVTAASMDFSSGSMTAANAQDAAITLDQVLNAVAQRAQCGEC